MGVQYNPSIVTNGLVLCLDAANNKSVPKNNILSTWTDYNSNQANYEILGPYSIKLKNTSTGWVGYFPATVLSTGKYIITFTYYSDSDGSSLVLDNDGIMDNTYNTTLTTNISPQTYTGSVDVSTTGLIQHYFRRNGGGNIFVTNVSYFKLETTWTDLLGTGNNGTLTNGPTYSSANGGSIVFDGTNDYVSASNTSLVHRTSNWAYSCWVNFNGTPSLGTIFENGSWTSCLLIRFETNGISIYSMSSYWGKFTLTPTLNTWYKLDFIRNGNSIDFYLNGTYSQSLSFTADIQPSSNLFIGMSQHAAGQCFNGRIAQTQIYNRALTASEVQQNFNALRGRFGI